MPLGRGVEINRTAEIENSIRQRAASLRDTTIEIDAPNPSGAIDHEPCTSELRYRSERNYVFGYEARHAHHHVLVAQVGRANAMRR
jgi:hypothetical protein